MPTIAAATIALAAVLGGALAVLHGRSRPGRAPAWQIGALHGLVGLAGFVLLLVTLLGPAQGDATGTGQFARDAVILLALALLTGLAPIAARIRRSPPNALLLGLHATFAMMALLLLAASL